MGNKFTEAERAILRKMLANEDEADAGDLPDLVGCRCDDDDSEDESNEHAALHPHQQLRAWAFKLMVRLAVEGAWSYEFDDLLAMASEIERFVLRGEDLGEREATKRD